jgi:hypothetical protein
MLLLIWRFGLEEEGHPNTGFEFDDTLHLLSYRGSTAVRVPPHPAMVLIHSKDGIDSKILRELLRADRVSAHVGELRRLMAAAVVNASHPPDDIEETVQRALPRPERLPGHPPSTT